MIDDLEARECLEIESVPLEESDDDPFVETLNLPVFFVKKFIVVLLFMFVSKLI